MPFLYECSFSSRQFYLIAFFDKNAIQIKMCQSFFVTQFKHKGKTIA